MLYTVELYRLGMAFAIKSPLSTAVGTRPSSFLAAVSMFLFPKPATLTPKAAVVACAVTRASLS